MRDRLARGPRLFLVLLAMGCVQRQRPATVARPSAWALTLAAVQRDVAAGQYTQADRRLAAFAQEAASAPEGAEALYWRALLAADPQNRDTTPRDALAAIDAYLALLSPQPHRPELMVLRRLVVAHDQAARDAESARSAAAAATQAAAAAVPARTEAESHAKAVEDELARARDSLTRTTAELERIRRRLGAHP